MKMKSSPTTDSMDHTRSSRGSFLIALVIVCFALSPQTRAACDSPDPGCPGGNLAEGYLALGSLTTGVYNTGIGVYSLLSITDGSLCTGVGAGALFSNSAVENTATGAGALFSNTTGFQNTANGTFALFSNSTGFLNTAAGDGALEDNTEGGGNTAIGYFALHNNITGGGNIAIGAGSGTNLSTGDSNIYIGNPGVDGESSTTRIGIAKTTERTFILGIRGVTTDVNNAIPVLIDSEGQLGTLSSSARFKKEVKPMDEASEAILALKPVTFHYKSDKASTPQFGLIAEEVAEVNPDLVVRDKDGEIYTVRYDAVNAMLLNEFLKEHNKVEALEGTVAALVATVREQASQIQKVNARLEVNKPAPQTALNSH
jgi:hypothetical protein